MHRTAILITLLVLLAGSSLYAHGRKKKAPKASCPVGTELLAKFEWKKHHYKFEKPEGNEDIVTLQGDATSANWSSTVPVELVLIKGARDIDTLQVGGSTQGSFDNHTLTTPSGRTADISTVQFCAVPSEQTCQECKGKVTQLTLQYTGTDTIYIKVTQKVKSKKRKRRKKKTVTIFADTLVANELFTLVGRDRKGTLGTEIQIYVNGSAEPLRIHTSCSQPIGPGLMFGDFLVVEAFSKRGGRICPIGACAWDQGPPEIAFTMVDDAHIQVTVEDDVGIRVVELNYSGGVNLVDTTFAPGAPKAEFLFEIVDPGQDAIIQLVAWDLCGKAPCGTFAAPPTIANIQVASDGSYVVGTVTDTLGIQNLEFFNLINAELDYTDLTEGAKEAHFRINKINLSEKAVFGVLASNSCSAYVLDPSFSSLPELASRFRGDVERDPFLPKALVLEQNYPNPFREATVFRYTLPEEVRVELTVYDVLGREVTRLVSDVQAAGVHQVIFRAGDLPAGTYFYRFRAGDRVLAGQMIRVR